MAEQAVTQGFAKEMEAGVVGFRYVDFQDDQNAELAKAYRVASPSLVLVNVFGGDAVCWTPMPKVWPLVGKPDEFRAYVQGGVARYLRQTRDAAEAERDESKESEQ